MSTFSAFSSPLGACHLATPSTSSSLLQALPFLRISRKSKSTTTSSSSKKSKSNASSSYPTEKSAAATRSSSCFADAAPPSYSEAVGSEEDFDEIFDLYFESEELSTGAVEKRMQAWDDERRSEDRERVAREDREMSRSLGSMGL
ncbi:hypothetical protein RQP46_005901 [Phenoliferia psychrophenolica]